MVVIPTKMGLINRRSLIARLQRLGMATRAELAKELGLSQPTVGKIAAQLLKQGVIEVVKSKEIKREHNGEDEEDVRVGRPGIMLRLDKKNPRFLCIQLGVNVTCFSVMPVGVDSEDKWQIKAPTTDSEEEWLNQLKSVAKNLPNKKFWGILVSVPGIVDEVNCRVLFSPNLHWTEKADIGKALRKIWDSPVILVQEERALALGHKCLAEDNEDFLLVDFGEGVGGAAIVNGKLYTSSLPISGELGHAPVKGNSRKCGCGATGCLETLVSTRGLIMSFAEETKKSNPTWEDFVNHVKNEGIDDWLKNTLLETANVISCALNSMGLRKVVITGALTEINDEVIAYLRDRVIEGAMWARFGEVECVTAPRRRIAGLVWVGIEQFVAPVGTEKPALTSA